jgi:hypothetical protein
VATQTALRKTNHIADGAADPRPAVAVGQAAAARPRITTGRVERDDLEEPEQQQWAPIHSYADPSTSATPL